MFSLLSKQVMDDALTRLETDGMLGCVVHRALERQILEDLIDEAVVHLRNTQTLVYVNATGAIGGLSDSLWRALGASSTILGSRFSYDRLELEEVIGYAPGSFCDETVAEQMAAHAYWHGMELALRGDRTNPSVVGLGMTASVITGRERRGQERVHICVYTPERVENRKYVFEKPGQSLTDYERKALRTQQGRACDLMALNALFRFLSLPIVGSLEAQLDQTTLNPMEYLHTFLPNQTIFPFGLVAWNGYDLPKVREAFGEHYSTPRLEGLEADVVLLPGSFNPLHHGHIGLARMIERMTGRKVVYEMTNYHPNKGVISNEELERRMNQFRSFAPVVVSDHAPLYIDKARKYPGVPMVMGADAALELLNLVHYHNRLMEMFEVLGEFRDLGTILYVVGRFVEREQTYMTLQDLSIPDRFRDIFRDGSFREDVSSSEIRSLR